MTRNEYLFIERARYFSNPAYAMLFSDLVKSVLERCEIPIDSKSYSITVRKEDHQGISFNLNTRLICSIWKKRGNDIIALVINEEDVEKYRDKDSFIESGDYLFKNHRSTHIIFDLRKLITENNLSLFEDYYKSAKDGYNSNHKSPFHRHNMPEVSQIITDDNKRQEVFNYVESKEDPFKLLINRVLQKDRIREMIQLPTFYYQKAHDIFERFMSFGIAEQEMGAIIDEYDQFSDGNYLDYVESLPNGDKKEFADIIGRLIAHLDFNAAGKNEWNELKGKIVIAKSLVRQKIWIKSLIDFKKSEKNIDVVQSHSIRCALELLMDPNEGMPMLSKGHREKISQFLFSQPYDEAHPATFVGQLKTYFEPFNVQLTNKDNLTTVISACLYDKEIEDIWNDRGEPKNKFEALGKTKQKKYRALLDRYKEKVQQGGYLDDEVYKFEAIQHFQDTFDIETENFGENLIESLKKDTNLRYRNSQNFIKGLANHFPEDARTLFRILVDIKDEMNEGELSKLVKKFSDQAAEYEDQVRTAMGKDKISHTQDERSLSTYLTFLYPERFCFYMNGVYQPLAEYIGVDTKKAGKKYDHFLSLLEPLQDLIFQDEDLIGMVRKELSPQSFNGDITAAISQDIVYRLIKYGEKNFSIEEMKQLFEEYLDRVIPKSTRNYLSAIPIVDKISKEKDLIIESIYEFQDPQSFDAFLNKIDQIEGYKESNLESHGRYQAALRKYRDFLNEFTNEEFPEMIIEESKPQELNVILYGPPGTGKTYQTVERAISIIEENGSLDNISRLELRKRYEEYKEKGLINFVTFHQSFSYEDFIEGIKPTMSKSDDDEEDLGYEIQDGVFKELVNRINDSISFVKSAPQSFNIPSSMFQKPINKVSLGDSNSIEDNEIYDYCIKNDCIAIGYGEDIDFNGVKNSSDIRARFKEAGFELSGSNDFNVAAMDRFIFWMKPGQLVFVPNGNSKLRAIGEVVGEYKYDPNTSIRYSQFRKVKWLYTDLEIPILDVYYKKFSQQTIYQISTKYINQDFFTAGQTSESKKLNNYVLIIDEINRGNIASIFGELITLIEPDKRIGNDEATTTTLPYSKDDFGIPSNLHIIGTMNTADRSVEALDSALRRRFTFIEVSPDSKVIEQPDNLDVDLKGILTAINQRIEILLDKDHKIGHSYFMRISESKDPEEALKKVFANKVIPLLEEYFYGDLSKVGLILGEEFVKQRDNINDSIWAKGDFEKPDPPESSKFFLVEEKEWTLESFKSIYE